ncbi:PAS domain S-box protein [Oscillatoria sp. CS-180]|uniref:PAS domain S-box protein n=1 Tax=Oscillatoria sp. CS-180 TaxID=3021720 RepID=UPI00232BA655|nr:PAS domain S-box protein [Oscillatoria sp. CS-180]MDB9524877.1 PAS domain S-box protein [Oscillatoria sp. CS-180]
MLNLINFPSIGNLFVPHGHCYLWKPSLVSLHAVSDGIIAIAYFVIAFTLLYFVQQRQDVPFRKLFWLFAAFIAACGATHTLAIWTLWFPQYWFSGGIKAITAFISFYTAVALVPHIPKALTLPSPLQLEALNQSLSQEIAERKAAEETVNKLNTELEERVARRTSELAQAKDANEKLLQQEQAARANLENALDSLQDTAERLNIALSAADMGSWDWDIKHEQQYWSPKTKAILGVKSDSIDTNYAAWAERVHPEDLSRVKAAIAEAEKSRTIYSQEYRICLPDDSVHWVLARGRFIYNADGQPQRMIGVIQEITAAKQSILAIEESEARFRAVFEQAAVGMARLSASGHWLQVNQLLCDLLGYTAEELIGQSFQAITDPADLEADDHYYHQLLRGEIDSCRFEKRYLHKNGQPVWSGVTVSVERSSDGSVAVFIAVIEDIRQLKQIQIDLQQRAMELEQVNGLLAITNAVLEKRNSELDQFAYVASHDLKAPLRAISNLSEWIEEDLGHQIPDENKRQLALLRNRVHRMDALINGLLEYSRVNRRERQIDSVDVRQLLLEVIDLIDPPTSFTISIPDEMPTLVTNSIALNQVFSNLISNAVKHHNREDGHIQITAERQGEFVEFVVRDDGPGIEPQYHEKIFTIFQTLKARDTFESTGVGLAIVRKIIDTEGGSIDLVSDVGQGSTFRFSWPLNEPSEP